MREIIINEEIKEISNGKEYIRICTLNQLFEKKGIKVQFLDDDDLQVAIFKIKDKLFAIDNICPHRHTDKLYEGIIKDYTVMCPMHGWTYSLETGKNTNTHQGVKMLNCYDIYEKNGFIWIEKPQLSIPKWRDNKDLFNE